MTMNKAKNLMKKLDEKVEQHRNDVYAGMATLTTTALTAPGIAYADNGSVLNKVLSLATSAVSLVGGALIVWGGVKFGLAIKDHQGGNAMAEALATCGGGAVIVAAAAFFGTLDTDISA